MARQKSKLALVLLVIAILAALLYLFRAELRYRWIEVRKPSVPEEIGPYPTATPSRKPSAKPTPGPKQVEGLNLAVPFQAQAPRGDWSMPWQEACEEASSALVDAFWKGQPLSVEDMEARIRALVDWENRNFGYYEQTPSAQVAQMLREALGYKRVDVLYGAGLADIESNVRAGRPVIVPLAGRLLDNPYYTAPGPIYHMLVVKGIAENGDLITNDVGTRHGHNYLYSRSVFLNAMHDLPEGGHDYPAGVDQEQWMESGRRAIIVVYPN